MATVTGSYDRGHSKRSRTRSPPPRRALTYEAGAMEVDVVTTTRNVQEVGEPLGHCSKKKSVTWGGYAYTGFGSTTVADTLLAGETSTDGNTREANKCYYNALYATVNLLQNIKFGNSINQRKEACINVSGIQLDIDAMNNNPTVSTELHYAVIIAKQGANPTTSDGIRTDFFRHYGTTTGRDFNNPGTGEYALSGMELSNNPINPDLWHVVTHKKFLLAPGLGTTTAIDQQPWRSHDLSGTCANLHQAKLYIPINKQIRYQNTSSSAAVPQDDIRLVWWFALPFTYGVPKTITDVLPGEELAQLRKAYRYGINQDKYSTYPEQEMTLFNARAIVTYTDK